jgi:hypothetical protein
MISMILRTLHISGDTGKHTDTDNEECPGRAFDVKSSAVSGAHIDEVTCTTCSSPLLHAGGRVWCSERA